MIRRVLVLLGIGVFAGVLGILAAVMPAGAGSLTFDFTKCADISAPPHPPCPGDTGASSLTYTVSGVAEVMSGPHVPVSTVAEADVQIWNCSPA